MANAGAAVAGNAAANTGANLLAKLKGPSMLTAAAAGDAFMPAMEEAAPKSMMEAPTGLLGSVQKLAKGGINFDPPNLPNMPSGQTAQAPTWASLQPQRGGGELEQLLKQLLQQGRR